MITTVSFKPLSLSSFCVFTACFAYLLWFWLTAVDCSLQPVFKKQGTGLQQLIASTLALLRLIELGSLALAEDLSCEVMLCHLLGACISCIT